MSVYRCKDCDEITVTDDKEPIVKCAHCGSGSMACDHPSAQLDKTRQAFICSWCGAEKHTLAISMLRTYAHSVPELQNIIDSTNH